MNIRKIDLPELQMLAPKISELLAHSPQNNIFLTPEWLLTWWEFWSDNAQLYFLIAEQDRQLIGMAPLMLQKQSWLGIVEIRMLSFLNTRVAADHLNFVCYENMQPQVNQAFFSYLEQHHQEWDILSLEDLPELDDTISHAKNAFSNQFQISTKTGQLCPYLPLNSEIGKKTSWDAYLSQKSKNFRQQTRAKRRKFENKLAGQYIQCETKEQVQIALNKLAALNPERWNKKGQTSSFSDNQFQTFHIKIAETFLEKGWLDLAYLKADNNIIAVIYNYIYANKIFYYNTAFDFNYSSYSAGRVLMGYSIEQAFNKKLEEFDFLRGVHSYKYEWSELQRENQDLLVFKKGLKTILWDIGQKGKTALRQFLKKHLSQNLKFRLKSLLQKIS